MEKRNVSIVLFIKDNKILLQDRRGISKYGEEYAFFGGGIENGETRDEALKREIKEELSIEIKNFKFFKRYSHIIKKLNKEIVRNVYVSSMPDLKKLNVKEGKIALMDFKDSFNLNVAEGDNEILREIYDFVNRK